MSDPIVDEVRRARDKHAKAFDYDLHAICEDLRKREQQYKNRVVSLPPKHLQVTVTDSK